MEIAATEIPVVEIAATKKRGRPASGCALTQAERDRRYRLKRRFARLCFELRQVGLDPATVLRKEVW